MTTISLVSHFPPPLHGLSIAIETLYSSKLNKKFKFSKINICKIRYLPKALFSLWFIKSKYVYFTPSQSVMGNLRDLLILKILLIRRKRIIIHIHGGGFRELIDTKCPQWQKRINYNLLKQADKAIVLGKSFERMFEGIISRKNVVILPNCIEDFYLLKTPEEKFSAIKKTGSIHLLFLSNLLYLKGYRVVLEVALLSKRQNKNFQFHFAGKFFEQKEKEFFFNFIEKNHLKDYVFYHGIVKGQKKKDLLRQCPIFILPTFHPTEGQPISILEAMGNACTVITTNHLGILEILPEKGRYICDKDNINSSDIVDFLISCDRNRQLLLESCQINYRYAINHFSQEKYIDNFDKLFSKLCHQ